MSWLYKSAIIFLGLLEMVVEFGLCWNISLKVLFYEKDEKTGNSSRILCQSQKFFNLHQRKEIVNHEK